MKICIIIGCLFLASCSDAEQAAFSALGKKREVKCYSGSLLIYEGSTTGKIENETGSDGYFFVDTNSNYIEVNANCIFTNKQ